MTLSPLMGLSAGALGAFAVKKVGDTAASFLDLLRGGSNTAANGNADAGANASALSDAQKQSQTLLDQFKNAVQSRFAAAGINTAQPIHLAEDSFGDVVVDEGHPDRARIEQLFHDDPTLSALFRQLHASLAQVQQAGGVPAPTSNGNDDHSFGVTIVGDQVNVDFVA